MMKTLITAGLILVVTLDAQAQDVRASASKIASIDHLVINVVDMEKSLAFYKKLGLTLNNEDGWRKGQGQVSIQIGENQKLNIHQEPGITPTWKLQPTGADDKLSRAVAPVPGNADFCLVWLGTLQEAEQLLQSAGVRAISPARTVSGARGPSTSVHFRDLDGNLWEFTIYPKK
jgi:catechol 2,3-dioxygenase-like lactoylglutathione lyase family enzyme